MAEGDGGTSFIMVWALGSALPYADMPWHDLQRCRLARYKLDDPTDCMSDATRQHRGRVALQPILGAGGRRTRFFHFYI